MKGALYFTRQGPTDTERSSSRAENKRNRNLSDGTVTSITSKENIRLNGCSAQAFSANVLRFSHVDFYAVIGSFYLVEERGLNGRPEVG